MATLSSPGIGSGLDVNGIISKLMTVEQRPLVALGTRQVEITTQISAYGALKSAVSNFRDAIDKLSDISKFKVYAATSADQNVLTATASPTAAKGTYTLQVNRIAENHRMAAATTYANTDTALVGALGDTMTINVGGSAFVVDSGGKTLAQVRDAINNAANNTGVTASILKDNVGYRLSLSANETGSAKALSVSYSAADPFSLQTLNADRDASGGFTAADLDASVTLEGRYNITSSSNSLSETIQGVTLTLKKAGTTTVNVDRDTAAVQTSVQNFAKSYSSLIQTIDKLRTTTLKADGASLLTIEAQLRSVLNGTASAGSFNSIFELGVSTQKDGTLSVDSNVLTNAINSDFNGVANLFADKTNGLAVKLKELADSFLQTGGVIDGHTEGLNQQARDLANQKTALQTRLASIQDRYTKQFNALDQLLSQLNTTGTLLTQQLASLPGLVQKKSSN